MLSRIGIGAPFLLCIVLILGCGPARPNSKDIERDLAKAVPLQSSPAQVLDYLAATQNKAIRSRRLFVISPSGRSLRLIVESSLNSTIMIDSQGTTFRIAVPAHRHPC